MQKIENKILVVKSKPGGAELCSLFNKQTNFEYLWQAGSAWPKQAPVLFPIVGQLKDNIYYHEDKQYTLDRHGFARNKTFIVSDEQTTAVEYSLIESNETLQVFPFHFELRIKYELQDATLKIIYKVLNTGNSKMFFSIGGHPAFKVPLTNDESYNDYYLEFNKTESADRWLLNNGLLDNITSPFLSNVTKLPLKKSIFYEDALVFKNLQSDVISVKSKNSKHGLNFHFEKYPYFGIWAAKDADFICLEPWHGITDNTLSNQQLKDKEGIIALPPGGEFYCDYSVEVF